MHVILLLLNYNYHYKSFILVLCLYLFETLHGVISFDVKLSKRQPFVVFEFVIFSVLAISMLKKMRGKDSLPSSKQQDRSHQPNSNPNFIARKFSEGSQRHLVPSGRGSAAKIPSLNRRRASLQLDSINALSFGRNELSFTTELEKSQTLCLDIGRPVRWSWRDSELPSVPQSPTKVGNSPIEQRRSSCVNLPNVSRKIDTVKPYGKTPLRQHHIEDVNNNLSEFDSEIYNPHEHVVKWLRDQQ